MKLFFKFFVFVNRKYCLNLIGVYNDTDIDTYISHKPKVRYKPETGSISNFKVYVYTNFLVVN